jgi:multidrug transporter EmrE-like cation transporter
MPVRDREANATSAIASTGSHTYRCHARPKSDFDPTGDGMLTLSPSLLVLIGILMTALAQVLLKKAAGFEVRTSPWITFFGLSAVAYAVSFIFYSQILKYFALNKIYPAMTIAQIVVITLLGFLMGEAVGARHALGLVFGAVAIYLILA